MAPNDQPAAKLDRVLGPDGVLTLVFSGVWAMDIRLPSPDATVRELDRAPPPPRVVVATAGLARWDSALLAFLRRIEAACRARGLALDLSALPSGMRRLLELAGTIEPATAEPTLRRSLAQRVGERALLSGARAHGAVTLVGELAIGAARWLRAAADIRGSDVLLMMQRCGAEALPIVSVIAFLVGMILAFIANLQLSRFGAAIYVADLVTIAMMREMGAIMTGIVLAGRTGAAYAAELAAMQANEEVDALATIGLKPAEFLVLPRVFALAVMMPLLCLYADAAGILGGVLVGATRLNLTAQAYLVETQQAATMTNLAIGLLKGVVFGVLVGFTGCRRGLAAARNATAVGQAATSAVVSGILQIIIADAIFAVALSILGI